MKALRLLTLSQLASGLVLVGLVESVADINSPPQVSIVFPDGSVRWEKYFRDGTVVKIKADARDPDGVIAEVRFYASTNFIGVATNSPFNVIWPAVPVGLDPGEPTLLKAVAVDNEGAVTESASVGVFFYNGAFISPVVEILSPVNGSMFVAPGEFSITAELLAGLGDNGPIEFFIGTNSVGLVNQSGSLTATSPPATVVVHDLPEGSYDLTVKYRGLLGSDCISCLLITNHVRVVRLGAIPLPRQPGEPFRFEVITVFTNQANVVERAVNLRDWLPIGTVTPSSNRFTFTDSAAPPGMQHFYRVVVPP